MNRVICIGNRFIAPDGAALWIYDSVERKKEQHVEWIEGGLGGMNLLPHFQTDQKILILDYFVDIPNASLFDFDEVVSNINVKEYSHTNAFYFLLLSLDDLLQSRPSIEFLSCNPKYSDYKEEIFTFVKKWSQNVL